MPDVTVRLIAQAHPNLLTAKPPVLKHVHSSANASIASEVTRESREAFSHVPASTESPLNG